MIEYARTIKKTLDKFKLKYMQSTLVIGDSHTCIFKRWPFTVLFPFVNFDVCMVTGATVSGLENPNSTTKAMPIFTDAIQHRLYNKVIVNIGEVDTGYVIWHRAEKKGVKVDGMLKDALIKYGGFLLNIKSYCSDITVISAPLPTIQDGNDWGEIANIRKEVVATQKERTALTIDFNMQMESFCRKNNISYLNFDQVCLGDDGMLKRIFLNKNKSDHHYSYNAYSYIVIKEMYKKMIMELCANFFANKTSKDF